MLFYRRQCVNLEYSLGVDILDCVSSMTDLGVIVDSILSRRDHVKRAVNKAYSMLGMIKR